MSSVIDRTGNKGGFLGGVNVSPARCSDEGVDCLGFTVEGMKEIGEFCRMG